MICGTNECAVIPVLNFDTKRCSHKSAKLTDTRKTNARIAKWIVLMPSRRSQAQEMDVHRRMEALLGVHCLSKSHESLCVGQAATCTMEGCWRLSIWRTLPSLRIHTHPELGSMRCSYLWSCLTMSLSGHRTLGCDIFVLGAVGGWHTLGRGGNWNKTRWLELKLKQRELELKQRTPRHWALCMVDIRLMTDTDHRRGRKRMVKKGNWGQNKTAVFFLRSKNWLTVKDNLHQNWHSSPSCLNIQNIIPRGQGTPGVITHFI